MNPKDASTGPFPLFLSTVLVLALFAFALNLETNELAAMFLSVFLILAVAVAFTLDQLICDLKAENQQLRDSLRDADGSSTTTHG